MIDNFEERVLECLDRIVQLLEPRVPRGAQDAIRRHLEVAGSASSIKVLACAVRRRKEQVRAAVLEMKDRGEVVYVSAEKAHAYGWVAGYQLDSDDKRKARVLDVVRIEGPSCGFVPGPNA